VKPAQPLALMAIEMKIGCTSRPSVNDMSNMPNANLKPFVVIKIREKKPSGD
jgi:hypothetical protein